MLRMFTTLACLVPALALSQALGGPVRGDSLVINDGPGDQTDPHVSGALVAYTSQLNFGSEIRYHDLVTGEDRAIPNEGGYDFIADVSGDTVVFTRLSLSSGIYRFDVSAGGAVEELAPRPGADRRSATIGHQTVAWQDFGYTSDLRTPELAVYGLDTGVLTRLSEDERVDRTPAVSPDGRMVVWSKCAIDATGCDLWQARAVEGGYLVTQLTGTEGEEVQPDTNGEVVVYVSRRLVDGVLESDIAWQPVDGGEVRVLSLPGTDSNPNVSGSLIAFERWDESSASFDIVLYDLRTETFYRLTETPQSETLSDISVSGDGQARVVWTVREDGDFNVYAYTFQVPGEGCEPEPGVEEPAAVCASPGSRPLLGLLEVSRSTGKPDVAATQLEVEGPGVLCVDNGFEGTPATAGWVWLGEALQVGPEHFGKDVRGVAQALAPQGRVELSARVAGKPGSSFRVRVYGEPACGGTSVQPVSLASMKEAAVLSHYFVPNGYEGTAPLSGGGQGGLQEEALSPVPLTGCSTGGGSGALLGVLLLASALLRGTGSRQGGVCSYPLSRR